MQASDVTSRFICFLALCRIVDYYLSLASTSAGYYVDEKGIEPAGVWYGPCAAEFGLSGIVQADHLSRLCEGVDPHDPEKNLVRNAKTEGRAHGTDLCFSTARQSARSP